MKRRLAHLLKRTARLLIKAANRLDGPVVTLYDAQWNMLTQTRGWHARIDEGLAHMPPVANQ